MKIEDKRIPEYQYLKQLKKYIDSAQKRYIEGETQPFIYPRQLEIHLPSDRISTCNATCKHCFGATYKKALGHWEQEGLALLHNLKGAVPFHIYGGSYTEPTMNPFLFSYIATTKMYNNHFGIHTNGILLKELDDAHNTFQNMHDISTDKQDYISISLDAGSGTSWKKLKGKSSSKFYDILYSIEKMCEIRAKSNKYSHAIRMVYLASEDSCKEEELDFIMAFAKNVGVDSLRFSVPYDFYNKDFKEVKKYKESIEDLRAEKIAAHLQGKTSKSEKEIPYIFWNPPFFTDIDRFDFEKCYYGLFQITLAADGYVYPCSSVAAPSAEHLRRGAITSNINAFNYLCWDIQNNKVQCKEDCFCKGLRGNRMALEINEYYNNFEPKK